MTERAILTLPRAAVDPLDLTARHYAGESKVDSLCGTASDLRQRGEFIDQPHRIGEVTCRDCILRFVENNLSDDAPTAQNTGEASTVASLIRELSAREHPQFELRPGESVTDALSRYTITPVHASEGHVVLDLGHAVTLLGILERLPADILAELDELRRDHTTINTRRTPKEPQ